MMSSLNGRTPPPLSSQRYLRAEWVCPLITRLANTFALLDCSVLLELVMRLCIVPLLAITYLHRLLSIEQAALPGTPDGLSPLTSFLAFEDRLPFVQ